MTAAACLLSISLVSCGDQESSYGMMYVKQLEFVDDEKPVKSVFSDDFAGIQIGRTQEVTDAIVDRIALYTEGAFNDDTEAALETIFPGVFDSAEAVMQYQQMHEERKNRMKYTLYESYPNYISRAVETDNLLVFVVENRTKFDVALGESQKGGYKSIEQELFLNFGKRFTSYNKETATFTIDGSHVIYALTPKDTMSFYFLSEQVMHHENMRGWVTENQLIELRRYFAEAPLYQNY